MDLEIKTFRDVLDNVAHYPARCWVYLPEDESWTLASRSAILESEEVPPELEDEPGAGIPVFARDNHLMQALAVGEVQAIIQNARLQKPAATNYELLEAFLHYYDNDAYISW